MKNRLKGAAVIASVGAVAVAGISGVAGAKASATSHAVKTYTIAYEGPLSGGNAQLGLNMKYAVQLAVQNWNAGKNVPFKLDFTAADDQGSGTFSPGVATQLVSNSQVIGVVGPAFSGATKAAQAVYGPAGMPLVSPSATNPALSTSDYNSHHNFFRVVADDSAQGPADADYAVKVLKAKKVFVVDDGSSYGSGLAQQFAAQAKKDGATVTTQTAPGTTSCAAGSGDVSQYPSLASQVKSKGVALTFYGGYYCDFGLLTGALHTAGYSGKLMSGDGSLDPHYIDGTTPKSAANGALITCACTNLGKSAADVSFTKGFAKLAGFPVGTYSAEAFDAANTIITVLKGEKSPSRAATVAGLKKVKFAGLTKTVQFQANGNIAGKAIYVYTVKSGAIVELGAA